MSKYTVYSFDNPYLDNEDGENRYSAAVIMDEARERWRTGNWRAKREAFDVSRKDLTENTGGTKPSSARFRLDVRKDLMGDTISLKKLSEVGGQAVLGRQSFCTTPWLTERHGYDPTCFRSGPCG